MSEDEAGLSPEASRAARQTALDRLVPSLDPSDYGKMPPSYHSNSQRLAPTTIETDEIDGLTTQRTDPTTASTQVPRKPIRAPIIPRDQYDGVDSDDETDSEGEQMEDDESEEDKPQVVGEIEIDMEEEQEEFLEFAKQALGVSDEQWSDIIQERRSRGGTLLGLRVLYRLTHSYLQRSYLLQSPRTIKR